MGLGDHFYTHYDMWGKKSGRFSKVIGVMKIMNCCLLTETTSCCFSSVVRTRISERSTVTIHSLALVYQVHFAAGLAGDFPSHKKQEKQITYKQKIGVVQ